MWLDREFNANNWNEEIKQKYRVPFTVLKCLNCNRNFKPEIGYWRNPRGSTAIYGADNHISGYCFECEATCSSWRFYMLIDFQTMKYFFMILLLWSKWCWLVISDDRFLQDLGWHYSYCWCCLFPFFSFLLLAFVLLIIIKPLIMSLQFILWLLICHKKDWKHVRSLFKKAFKKQYLFHIEKIRST